MTTLDQVVVLAAHAAGGPPPRGPAAMDVLVAGAALLETMQAGMVEVVENVPDGRSLLAPVESGDPVDRRVLDLLTSVPVPTVDAVVGASKDWYVTVRDDLVERELLSVEEQPGLFRKGRWLTADADAAQEVWDRMAAVVRARGTTDDEVALHLVRLLGTVGHVPRADLAPGPLGRLVDELADGHPVTAGVLTVMLDRELRARVVGLSAADAGVRPPPPA